MNTQNDEAPCIRCANSLSERVSVPYLNVNTKMSLLFCITQH